MSSDRSQRELLNRPVVDWDKISLRYVAEEGKDEMFASIIRKNPPKEAFESLLAQWIDSSEEARGWSKHILMALTESHVDADLMEEYFAALRRLGCVPHIEYEPEAIVVAILGPSKLQCLLSFLSSINRARVCSSQLLMGQISIFSSSHPPRSLWDIHCEESWELLQAIVHGMNTDQSERKPFLEQYLDTLLMSFSYCGAAEYSNDEIDFEGALSECCWSDHLELVAKFAPALYMEQNKSTGNTFLNHLLTYQEEFGCYSELFAFSSITLDLGRESAYIPNLKGRTALGLCSQNMLAFCEQPGHCSSTVTAGNLYLFLRVAEKMDYLAMCPCANDSSGETPEPAPIFLIIGGFVTLLSDLANRYTTAEVQVDITEGLNSFFSGYVPDECNADNLVDGCGNTPLHTAVAKTPKAGRFSHRWVDALLRSTITRLVTPQTTLTRNNDGKLPIDLALESDKQSWISVALSEAAPKLLEHRNPTSKLYPFQMMASSSVVDITHDGLSSCYSMLRMAPHLVATALAEENTAFLQRTEFIAVSRLKLEIYREWMMGNLRVRDLRQRALEEEQQTNSRKRQRLQDAEQLIEGMKNRETSQL